MRRVLKALGVLAGIGAALWFMRDRLVTLTIAREPEPPRFRVPEPSATPVPDARADDLTEIQGIGPTYAERLRAAGIDSLTALAAAGPSEVADIAGVSTERAEAWIEQAAILG